MKKSIFTVVAFMLLFSYYEAFSIGCEVCTPNLCTQFSLNVPGCGTINYTVCYSCGVTHGYIYFQIVEITDVPPACVDAVWDAGNNYILSHKTELCGEIPCSAGTYPVVIQTPLCIDIEWNGSSLSFKANPLGCDYRCCAEYNVCWCDCLPSSSCFDPIACANGPYRKYVRSATPVWYEGANGSCPTAPIGQPPYLMLPGQFWVITCANNSFFTCK